MKIKDYKCKCGHDDFFFANKGNQKGIYCSYCGKWLKWADKDEQNLSMKQESVLGEPCDECLSVIFPECRYCIHHTLRCMPDDHACEKCVIYDPIALPSGYKQKEE